MSVRRVPLLGGILAFVGGLAILVGAWTVGIAAAAITIVAVCICLIALYALVKNYDVRDRGRTPDPERRLQVPAPGTSLVDAIEAFRPPKRRYARADRIRDGLSAAAVAVLTRFAGLTEKRARERIADGSWTTDPHAAAFLSPSVESPSRSFEERVSAVLGRDDSFREGVRRTAAAVAAVGTTADGRFAGGAAEGGSPRDSIPQYDDELIDVPALRTSETPVAGRLERASRATGHWAGVGVVALLAIGVGALAESAAVLMAGVVAFGYAGIAHALEAPAPDVSVERTVGDETPEPGDEVSVELTVTNESRRLLPDVRVVDGVPESLAVTDGRARLGTALRPGESVSLEYTVTVQRGTHAFDPVLVFARDLARSTEREFLFECPTELVCEPVMRPLATPVPLRTTAATFAGRLTTREGGSGTQFHSVREYRRNDPLNRIDWNRHARTGDLATLQFHEERAARVLVVVDARGASYLAPDPDAAHAVDRSVAAASRIATTLLEDGDAVGLAAIGPLEGRDGSVGSAGQCWLAPGSGHHHRVRFQRLLATHPQFDTRPPSGSTSLTRQLTAIHRRLSSETQVVLLTPLCDRGAAHIARWLDARGHAVTVVSPDPTTDRTAGHVIARLARRIRRFDLRRGDVPVVDWPHEETIDEAFARIEAIGSGGPRMGTGGGR